LGLGRADGIIEQDGEQEASSTAEEHHVREGGGQVAMSSRENTEQGRHQEIKVVKLL
jgi:hypothetical protein